MLRRLENRPPLPHGPAGPIASAGRTLLQAACLQAAMLGLVLAAAFTPRRSADLAALMAQGAAGLVGGALIISLTATLVCLLVAAARARHSSRPAGWPQAILLLAGMSSAAALLHHFTPRPEAAVAAGWPAIAGLLLLPAFLLLVAERMVAAIALDTLPEAPLLAALLRVPALVVLALSVLAAAAGFGVLLFPWPEWVLNVLLLALAGELALRSLGVWFTPRRAAPAGRAAIASLLAGLLQPGALRPSTLAGQMRTRLGIDVSRSWAVGYVRAAAPPVALGLLVLGWASTGLTRIGPAERGAYEQFGAPVAVLPPGLHAVLPWPFGQVRRLEYGVVHTVTVGVDPGRPATVDTSTADGPPPAAANRLWDDKGGQDISYLIASRAGGRESFETVSVDISVLYRIGLDDLSARRALYGTVAPDPLVRALSGRRLAHFFAQHTLDQVLGARREQVADGLRRDLQAELDDRHSGIEVVAVVIESMHPPAGAAPAYRSVQAAEITASASRAEETGRAYGTLSAARRSADRVRDDAAGLAAELVGVAQSERWQSDADSLAWRGGGEAFLLERYFSNLRTALGRAALEIVDDRLGTAGLPVVDLRDAARIGGTGP